MEKKPGAILIRAHNPLATLQAKYQTLEQEHARLKAEYDPLAMLKALHRLEVDNLQQQIVELEQIRQKLEARVAQLQAALLDREGIQNWQ